MSIRGYDRWATASPDDYPYCQGDDDVVEDGNECPECGEARVDWLICQDDDTVKCATCGMVYALKVVEDGD